MRPPPGPAKWLLTSLAPSTPESVLGDLQEEYEGGRSTGWYCRQVFRAIVTATARQINAHPVLTVRAVLLGWALLWVLFEHVFSSPFFVSPAEWLFVRGVIDIRWWPKMSITLLVYVIACLALAGAGRIIARFHRRELVLIFIVTVLAWNLTGTLYAMSQGWLREGLLASVVAYLVVVPLSILLGAISPRKETAE